MVGWLVGWSVGWLVCVWFVCVVVQLITLDALDHRTLPRTPSLGPARPPALDPPLAPDIPDVQRTPNVCCEDIFDDGGAQRSPQFHE